MVPKARYLSSWLETEPAEALCHDAKTENSNGYLPLDEARFHSLGFGAKLLDLCFGFAAQLLDFKANIGHITLGSELLAGGLVQLVPSF